MTLHEWRMWSVRCDGDGCEADAQEHGEHAAWSDHGTALDEAVNVFDWLEVETPEGARHYCPKHTEWDEELDERVLRKGDA